MDGKRTPQDSFPFSVESHREKFTQQKIFPGYPDISKRTLFLDSPKVIVKNPFTGKGIPIPAGVGFQFGASLGPNVEIQHLDIGEESMNVRAVFLVPRDLFKQAAYLPGDEYRRERVEVVER
mmetsp:Transcript_43199/g.169161  ORF Transcript_43199/g.169161 Transcript_43199/m.169161 type:complete len:122 (-) Transcript_43199:238-603(-)